MLSVGGAGAGRDVALGWIAIGLFVLATGCSHEAVREDRSINYSRDGGGVGFQHGDEGVFVASGEGAKVEKIFDAGDDVIATSSPLWSPVDRRLIFTTARPAAPDDNRARRAAAAWDSNPAGRGFQREAIVYTCMLRPPPTADSAPPIVLFEARSDHVGYVAANLAVRWHPSGDSILFVDQTAAGEHSLFEFDLSTSTSRRIFAQSADALVFDWSPVGQYLVCALAGAQADPGTDGVWVRRRDDDQWWRVPKSEFLRGANSDGLIERLRGTRPAWTADDRLFAFVVSANAKNLAAQTAHPDRSARGDQDRDEILLVDVESREVTSIYDGSSAIHDVQWRFGHRELGFVEGSGAWLRIIDQTGAVLTTITGAPIRRFAGWNHDGSRLAYVTPESPSESDQHWALLFPRIRASRDLVHVATSADADEGRLVHSGIRITFPQWSPSGDSLSLWGTYAPTHRSWLSIYLPWTLRPGDPAAVLDCGTGQLSWMAVNPQEEAQVGHYYLLKRDYESAWSWYAKSATLRQPAGPIRLAEIDPFLRQLRVYQDSSFFEYYCLTKLDRHTEAADRLRQFRQSMSFDTTQSDDLFPQSGLQGEALQAELSRLAEFVTPLLQCAYVTEVYFSLDAVPDGIVFLRRELQAATTDAAQLAYSLCLSQLLLASDDHEAYIELVMNSLVPLLMRMHRPTESVDLNASRDLPAWRSQFEQSVLLMSGSLALLPTMSPEFLSSFSEDQLHSYLARWQMLRETTKDDLERLSMDLILFAILTRLKDDDRWEVAERIRYNPQRSRVLPFDDPRDIDQFIEEIRGFSG